jgi:hypothetical protein
MSSPEKSWNHFDDEYVAFARHHPELCLTKTRWGAVYVRRVHGAALLAADAARRTRSGRWLANRETFDRVVFDLLTRGPEKSALQQSA